MPVAKRKPRSQPAWTDIKARLAGFDRRGLMGLIQDLYGAHKENRTFLHARLGVGSLAQILGYSEVSAFTWFFTGMARQPPSAWRQAELAKANV